MRASGAPRTSDAPRPLAAPAAAAALLGALSLLWFGDVPEERGSTGLALRLAAFSALIAAAAFAFSVARGGTARRIVARAALSLSPPLALLAALEGPVIAAGYDWRRMLPPDGDDVFIRLRRAADLTQASDPVLLHARPPSSRVTGTTFGDCVGWLGAPPGERYPYDVSYDARGYRNSRELLRADVVVIGDSFVEAALVATHDLFTERLAQALQVAVANLGVGGYGPQQELEVLRRHATPLSPRLVYWCLFEGNDLLDAARYDERRAQQAQSSAKRSGFLIRSFSANAFAVVRGLLRPPPPSDPRRARDHSLVLARGPSAGTRLYFPYPAGPLDDLAIEGLGRIEATLDAAREHCRAMSAELVVVFIPEKFRVHRAACHDDPEAAAGTWTLSDLPERVAALLSRLKLPWIDLTAPLQREAATGPLLYFSDDGHWTAAAHARVAELLRADAVSRLN